MYRRCTNLRFSCLSKVEGRGFTNNDLTYRFLTTCHNVRTCGRLMQFLRKSYSVKNVNILNRASACRYYCSASDLNTSIASSVLNHERNASADNGNSADEQLLKEVEQGLSELEELMSANVKIVPTVVRTVLGEDVNSFTCSNLNGKTTAHPLPRSGNKVFELFGTPDPKQPASNVPCHGCGSHLHCKDPGIPGYLPSQAYLSVPKNQLKGCLCQRCQLLKTHEIALDVTVSLDDYDPIIREIKRQRALVIMLVDMTDLSNSFHPTFAKLLGWARPTFVVGNKIDLILKDNERYLDRALETLMRTADENGFSEKSNVRHFTLVSAKTGFGVEDLITKILDEWRLKGHVYIVGCANSGKSTMFNTLLSSDLCRGTAKEIIQRATTSVWPGTTLNLLKFPIVNPKLELLHARKKRLEMAGGGKGTNERALDHFKATIKPNLHGMIGSTTLTPKQAVMVRNSQTGGFLAPSYSFEKSGENDEGQLVDLSDPDTALDYVGMNRTPYDETKFRNWCFDTPGLINPDQIINMLNQKELLQCVPKDRMTCRTFFMKGGLTMFVSGLSRIDCLEGEEVYFSVFTSLDVPIHVMPLREANQFYKDKFGKDELGIPIGDEERLKSIPKLVGKDIKVKGVHSKFGVIDIVLSSLGWVTVTLQKDKTTSLTAYTPGGAGCKVREPPLLQYAINFRGRRIMESYRYRTLEEEEEEDQRKKEEKEKKESQQACGKK